MVYIAQMYPGMVHVPYLVYIPRRYRIFLKKKEKKKKIPRYGRSTWVLYLVRVPWHGSLHVPWYGTCTIPGILCIPRYGTSPHLGTCTWVRYLCTAHKIGSLIVNGSRSQKWTAQEMEQNNVERVERVREQRE
eukprot:SAG11_NODE_2123_length_3784_cov_2.412754_1_plen_133_part_00